MWLLFKLFEETKDEYIYAYSRETEKLDGEIRYDKKNQDIHVTKPCEKDDTSFAKSHAERSFRFVVKEGFPPNRMVAFG